MPPFTFSYTIQIPQLLTVAVANFMLGWLWYSPVAPWFPSWVKAAGLNPDPKNMSQAEKDRMPLLFGGAIVSSFALSYVLQLLVRNLQAASFAQGARVGLFMAIGVAIPFGLGTLWEGRKGTLAAINIGNYIVALGLFGGLLAIWN